MYSAPKHSAARKHHPLRKHIAALAVATSTTLVTGVSLSPPAFAGSVWDSVAACESSGNWAIHTGNGYYGGLQFSASTWKQFGGEHYAPAANRANRGTQIGIARRVLAAQGPGAWPVCGKRAGLTKNNGGATATVSRSRSRTAITGPRLVVDGVLGPATIRATQRWVGITPNGVLRPRTVKALQRRLGVTRAGVIGPRTMRALQVKVSARRDGARKLNAVTVAALQRYLNRHP